MSRPGRRWERGVSLIEAIVAFGVMAFGMLAVIGMQAGLRVNGDLARQRAEAVRIAQAEMERLRSFSTMGLTANKAAYANIVGLPGYAYTPPAPPAAASAAAYNTTYTITRRVHAEPVVTGAVAAQRQSVTIDVDWVDRNQQSQYVRMSTVISGIEPALEGSLSLTMNADPMLMLGLRSRNSSIPLGAVNIGSGNSGWIPPGQPVADSRVAWVFNNATAVITLCTTTATSASQLATALPINLATDCSGKALLVSGYLRRDASAPPSTSSIANPTGTVMDMGIFIDAPSAPSVPTCYTDVSSSTVAWAYYCAVPITSATPKWTGIVRFTSAAMATSGAAFNPALFKACRYAQTASSYTDQAAGLVNQNFVFIAAGDGASVYTCPAPTLSFQP